MPRLLKAPNFKKCQGAGAQISNRLRGFSGWATYVFAVWETFPRLVLWAPKCICMHLSEQRSANGKQKPTPSR